MLPGLALLLVGGCAMLRVLYNRRRIRSIVERAVDRHLDKLVGLRAELLEYRGDGRLRSRAWDDEIERFMNSQLAGELTAAEARALEKCRGEVARLIAARVGQAAASPVWYRS